MSTLKLTILSLVCFAPIRGDKPSHAVTLNPEKDINIYETLCKYCADNEFSLEDVTDFEFNEAVEQIQCVFDDAENDFHFWLSDDIEQ